MASRDEQGNGPISRGEITEEMRPGKRRGGDDTTSWS